MVVICPSDKATDYGIEPPNMDIYYIYDGSETSLYNPATFSTQFFIVWSIFIVGFFPNQINLVYSFRCLWISILI